jgi:ADP-ribose pyrophosphatase YjhB (NUDIX family)
MNMSKEKRQFGLGVLTLIFNKNLSKILLLKRNQEKRNKNKADWGFVGGRVELGEKIKDACTREIKEEIGINISVDNLKFLDIKENPYLTEIYHAVWFIYFTTLDEEEKIIINRESDEYRWFDINNLPEKMIDSLEEAKNLIKKAKELR